MGSISFINRGGGGGGQSASANVYVQEAEPETKEGIWIKADKPLNKILIADIEMDTKWDTENIYPILPVASRASIATSIGDDIYIFGGYETPTMAYKYNTVSKEYTKLKDLPYTNIYEQCCAAIGTDIYFLYSSSISDKTSKVCKYDTITDTYTELGTVQHTGYCSSLVALGNYIYIFGGHSTKNVAGKYDITSDTYTLLAGIPGKPYKLCAVTDNAYIYLFCRAYTTSSSFNNISYKYNIEDNSYTKITDVKEVVSTINYTNGIAPILNGNKVYLFGYSDRLYNKKAYEYDIQTDSYTEIDDMLYGVSNAVSVKVNNSIYIFGGQLPNGSAGYDNNYKTVQVLNLGGELPEGVVDGSVIIANGNTYSTELISADNIEGRVTSTFSDVIYYDNGTQDNSLPTYYGTGAAWVKFKN